MEDALKLGTENSHKMRTARLDLDIARSKVKETTAIGLPQVNAEGNFTHFIDIPVQVIPDFISPVMINTLIGLGLADPSIAPTEETFVEAQFGTKFATTSQMTASQLLFDGTYLVGLQATKTYVGFSETLLRKSEEEVRKDIRNAYHTALLARDNVGVLTASRETAAKLLTETKALLTAGFAEQTDADQLDLTLSQLDSQIKLAESQDRNALNALKFLMGLPVSENISLADPMDKHVEAARDEALLIVSFNSATTTDHRIVETNVMLQTLLLRKERSAHMPSLSAFFAHSQNAYRNEFNFFDSKGLWFPSTFWGLSLDIPIWSSGMRHQRVQQARMEIEKAEIMKDQTVQALNLEFENAKGEFVFALENLQNAQKGEQLADKIHQRTIAKFKEGMASSFELTQSENQLLTARGQLLAAKLRLLNAKTSMDKLLNRI
jgi:outer membrane protein